MLGLKSRVRATCNSYYRRSGSLHVATRYGMYNTKVEIKIENLYYK